MGRRRGRRGEREQEGTGGGEGSRRVQRGGEGEQEGTEGGGRGKKEGRTDYIPLHHSVTHKFLFSQKPHFQFRQHYKQRWGRGVLLMLKPKQD
jgi:hypothetical protein